MSDTLSRLYKGVANGLIQVYQLGWHDFGPAGNSKLDQLKAIYYLEFEDVLRGGLEATGVPPEFAERWAFEYVHGLLKGLSDAIARGPSQAAVPHHGRPT